MNGAAPALASGGTSPTLGDGAFREFQRLALELTGIHLAANQRAMVAGRFAKRLRALGLDGYESYLELVRDMAHAERAEFVDTITTNLTYFFREPHHFAYLRDEVLPERAGRARASSPLRIWSAGCSAGQEPYSIAMVVRETAPAAALRILATDIDSRMLRQTREGLYSEAELRGLATERRERWMVPDGAGRWRVDARLRELLVCKSLNLFAPWPIRPGIDAIFCRNVLIYFDAEHQTRLIAGFAAVQRPGDHLFIGHSENLADAGKRYERVANTVYRRR